MTQTVLIESLFSCLQVVIELYRLLEKINREVQFLHHTDTICDFLYPFSLICSFTLKVVNYSVQYCVAFAGADCLLGFFSLRQIPHQVHVHRRCH